MAKSIDKIAQEIRELPDVEKLRLVDAILADLDKPDPEIDRVWAEEARKRGRGKTGHSEFLRGRKWVQAGFGWAIR
jgi:hypothetical protein